MEGEIHASLSSLTTVNTPEILKRYDPLTVVVCASGRVVVQSRQLACFVILSRSIRTVRH